MGRYGFLVSLFVVTLAFSTCARGADGLANPYARWRNGPSSQPDFFPIAVWLQDPRNAPGGIRRRGINLYVGLWEGPTEEQLAALKPAGMPVLRARTHGRPASTRTIRSSSAGCTATSRTTPRLSRGQGLRPADLPGEDRRRLYGRAADPNRPVMLNLGQGVAWDDYRPRRAAEPPRGLRRVHQGRRHRFVRHLPGGAREPGDRGQPVVRRQGRRPAAAVDAGQGGLELHRVHPHRTTSTQATPQQVAPRCGCP